MRAFQLLFILASPSPYIWFFLTKYTLSHVVIRIFSICSPFGWAIEILGWCFSCAPGKLPNAMLIFVWWNLTLSPPVKTKTEFLLTISIQSQVDKQWEYRKISIRDYHLTQYQILQTEIISNVRQTVWRITIELLLDCGSKRVKISVPQAPLQGQDSNTYKSFIVISTVWVKDWWRKPWTTVFLTCKKLAPHSMEALKHLQSI